MRKIILALICFNSFVFSRMILDISTDDKNRITNILNEIRYVKPSLVDSLINADESQDGTGSAIWEDNKYKYIFKLVGNQRIGIFIITEIYNRENSFIKELNIRNGTILLIDGKDPNKIIWSNIVTLNKDYLNFQDTETIDITTYGTETPDNLSLYLADALDVSKLSTNINGFRKTTKFQLTPSFTAGYKDGFLKNGDNNQVLNNITIFINDNTDSNYDYLHGIDVSHHQGTIDWSLMKNDKNVKFAYIKTTEGYGLPSSSEETLIKNLILSIKFNENITGALHNNIFTGLYHFIRPDLNPTLQGAENEAKTFVRFAKPYYDLYDMLPPAIDIENPPCKEPCPNYKPLKELFSANSLSLWVKRWLEVVEKEMGIEPIIYTYGGYNSYLIGLNNYDLWVARYPYIDGKFRPLNEHDERFKPTDANWANSTTPWKDWIIWQYTSLGGDYVSGISGQKLDRNVYRGTLEALKQWSRSKKN